MKRLWLLARRTAQEYGDDNCSQLAAAISFYALFSIVPLTLFAVSIFGLTVRDKSVQEDISNKIVDTLNIQPSGFTFDLNDAAINALYGPTASDEIRAAVDKLTTGQKEELASQLDGSRSVTIGGRILSSDDVTAHSDNPIIETVHGVSRVSGALTIVGLLGTAWSASALFASIRRSLNIVWDTNTKRPFVQQKLIDLGLVVGFGLLLGASIAATAAIITLRRLSDDALGPLSSGTGPFWSVVPLLVPGVLSFSVFALLYRYIPNVRSSFRTLWPGVVVATVLFELLKNGFSFYVANFTNYDLAFGTLGGVLLFMLWTYLSAGILLLGAELAVEYGRLRAGVYDAQPSGPSRSWMEHTARFVRGLFVHERAEAKREPDTNLNTEERGANRWRVR